MISTISFIAIFFCALFIVLSSIAHKVDIHPLTKGVLCVTMLGIIGILTSDSHSFGNAFSEMTIGCFAALFIRQTYISWDRGFV